MARFILAHLRRFSTNHSKELIDTHKRFHDYLRISLVERCNLRCTYCMPEEGVTLTPTERLLNTQEMLKLAELFVKMGVKKIRLTGGEPTLRADLAEIIAGLNRLRPLGLSHICMTTNGLVLPRRIESYVEAGLNSVNISLDTLVAPKYEFITRRKGLERVIAGIDAALAQPLASVKVNVVAQRGLNVDEINDFGEFTRDRKLEVRFIELMPFDGNKWNWDKFISYAEILKILKQRFTLDKLNTQTNETSRRWRIPGHSGSLGFIASMSTPFCGDCNRVRLTADGQLKVCLFGDESLSLRDAVRSGCSDYELTTLIGGAIRQKKRQHAGADVISETKNRPMVLIGSQFLAAQKGLFLNQSRFLSSDKGKISNKSEAETDGETSNEDVGMASLPHWSRFSKRRFLYNELAKESNSFSDKPESIPDVPVEADFTHLNASGVNMVDISDKPVSVRRAIATVTVRLPVEAFRLVKEERAKKGDVLTTAQLAGIQAAKKTSDLIPLCHQLPLSSVKIAFNLDETMSYIVIRSEVISTYRTGVEMEALTAASIAALTVYDMCKAVSHNIEITDLRLIEKTGGTKVA